MKTEFEFKLISVLFRNETFVLEGIVGGANGAEIQAPYEICYRDETEHVIESSPFILRDERTQVPLLYGRLFTLKLPLSAIDEKGLTIELCVRMQEKFFAIDTCTSCGLSAIEHTFQYSAAYFYSKGYLLTRKGVQFSLSRASRWQVFKKELGYLLQLLFTSKKRFSLLFTRLKTFLLRKFKRRPIWLVVDRIAKAEDCGEAMFHYLRAQHARTIDAYFILSPTCKDYIRLKAQYGKHIVPFKSKRHKQLHLLADAHLHSQVEYNLRNPLGSKGIANSDLYGCQPVVFLQHGVADKDISLWVNKTKNWTAIITSAKDESLDFLKNHNMGFSEDQLWLTGLSRFDSLVRTQSEKVITFMPTWRQNLTCGIDPSTGEHRLVEDFEQSTFVQMWSALMNHPRLKETAQRYGYSLSIRQHPVFQHASDRFPLLPHILQCQDSYKEIYNRSTLIVTDYSSCVYDFIYLRKPIAYFQFDRDEFYGGGHHTLEGSAPNYEDKGFGDVTTEVDAAVDVLCDHMENGCVLKPKYRERIDAFFAFNDQNACERIYHKLQAVCME